MADILTSVTSPKPKWIIGVVSLSIIVTLGYILFTRPSPAVRLQASTYQVTENKSRFYKAWSASPTTMLLPPTTSRVMKVYSAGSLKQNKMRSKIQPITVVTAYWNIGLVSNGDPNQSKDPERYIRYMDSFAYIENPVVAYFDDPVMQEKFQTIRDQSGFPTKTIVFDNRTELWGFSLEPSMKELYAQPDYPKSIPNFHSTYNCAMHAKYDAMPHAVMNNYFNTDYFAWCDLGYFRDMPKGLGSHYNFQMTLPPEFDTKKVAFTQVASRDDKLSLKEIFFQSRFWVAGGFFIGTADPLLKLAEDYRYSTEKFLRMNLSETDQQILYGMYSRFNQDIPRVEIQSYTSDGTTTDSWMFLGELLRGIWWNNHPIPNDCYNCNRSELIGFFS